MEDSTVTSTLHNRIYCECLFSLQYNEQQVEYPSWAQFIGTVFVLTSVLAIPVVLIFRLIFFESAREEALDFLRMKVSQFKDAYHSTRRWFSSIPQRFRELSLHFRGSWSPQVQYYTHPRAVCEASQDYMRLSHWGRNIRVCIENLRDVV